jgi:hypothetical protein
MLPVKLYQTALATIILDITLETIPPNIAKLMYIDKANFVPPLHSPML